MKISTIPTISAPQDMSTSFQLPAVYVGNVVNYTSQLVFTGAPVGTFKLQFSSDQTKYVAPTFPVQTDDITNWTDCTESAQSITEAGDHMWNVQNTGVMWVRVVYTAISGTGQLTVANFTVKGV